MTGKQKREKPFMNYFAIPGYYIDTDKRIKLILKNVAKVWGVPEEFLQRKRRLRSIVEPRQVAHMLCRKFTTMPLNEIGDRIGVVDHSTVIYSIKKAEDLFLTDSVFRGKVKNVEERLSWMKNIGMSGELVGIK